MIVSKSPHAIQVSDYYQSIYCQSVFTHAYNIFWHDLILDLIALILYFIIPIYSFID